MTCQRVFRLKRAVREFPLLWVLCQRSRHMLAAVAVWYRELTNTWIINWGVMLSLIKWMQRDGCSSSNKARSGGKKKDVVAEAALGMRSKRWVGRRCRTPPSSSLRFAREGFTFGNEATQDRRRSREGGRARRWRCVREYLNRRGRTRDHHARRRHCAMRSHCQGKSS